jgi:type I restriction enzyme S subunit
MNEPLTVQEAPAIYQVLLDTPHVRQGYKQTEVGVIPEDWDVKRLGDVLHVRHGKSQHHIVANNGQYPILATGGEIGRTNAYLYDKPSVLIGRKGTIDKPRYQDTPFWTVDTLFYTELSNAANPKFIYFKFQMIDWRSYNEASGVPSLNASTIENIEISIPDYVEQRAIATALSDVDALLTAQDKLIAKKRDIKQAAMQQLLTGKQRLPGFTGEWEVKRLGDICGRITTGKLDANAMVASGEYPFFTCAREHYFIDEYAFDADALLVSGNGANVGYVHHYTGKFNAYQRTYVLTDFSAEIVYLRLFMDRNLQERLRTEVNAGNTPYITMDTLTDMIVALPSTREEQAAIASVLSDMDADLTALEQQRDKIRDIKQGMMQELLTGRIRLV